MTFARCRAALVGAAALACVLAPDTAEAQLGGLSRKIKERVQGSSRPAAAAPAAAADAAAGPGRASARQVWANYDFIPGQRTLFYADFTDEEVGNFPRRLEFKTGSMEVVELDGQRALKASSPSGFVVPLPENLPQKFTIEVDVINRNDRSTAAATIKI